MKTPYDATLRLRQREMDDLRIAITVEVNQVTLLDRRCDAIDVAVRAETAIATELEGFSAYAFAVRMRDQRADLSRERAASDARVSALRARAIEAYGSLSAIAAAADRHRAEASHAAAIAEQRQVDDFSAARFTRAVQAVRRRRDRPTDALANGT